MGLFQVWFRAALPLIKCHIFIVAPHFFPTHLAEWKHRLSCWAQNTHHREGGSLPRLNVHLCYTSLGETELLRSPVNLHYHYSPSIYRLCECSNWKACWSMRPRPAAVTVHLRSPSCRYLQRAETQCCQCTQWTLLTVLLLLLTRVRSIVWWKYVTGLPVQDTPPRSGESSVTCMMAPISTIDAQRNATTRNEMWGAYRKWHMPGNTADATIIQIIHARQYIVK